MVMISAHCSRNMVNSGHFLEKVWFFLYWVVVFCAYFCNGEAEVAKEFSRKQNFPERKQKTLEEEGRGTRGLLTETSDGF